MASRAALAAPLLLQAPPGQVANVYEDLAGLVGSEGDLAQEDEAEFKNLASKVREEHNLQQHIIVELPEGKGKSILCASAVHASGSGRFLAPKQQLTYSVNHEALTTSDIKPYNPNKHVESLRSELEKQLSLYIEDRYATGLVEVFAVPLPRVQVPIAEETVQKAQEVEEKEEKKEEPDTAVKGPDSDDLMKGPEGDGGEAEAGEGVEVVGEEKLDETMKDVQDEPIKTAQAMDEVEVDKKSPQASAAALEEDEETEGETKLVVHIVANRYKLSNFWSGRWRSTYTLSSPTASELDGHINVQIHYFEEGNVQLNSNKSEQVTINSQGLSSDESIAKAIVRSVEGFEAKYQEELFNTCNELSEGAFRSLRRQLPMTKQKMDWDRVLNYNIGSELGE